MTYRLADDLMCTLDTIFNEAYMKKAKIDKLGRIVIPVNFRRKFKITTDTDLLIDCDSKAIKILPLISTCKLCDKEIAESTDIPLCNECINKIKHI